MRTTLETVRRTIRKAVPDAEETISYNMPAYRFNGPLLYFSAFKNHYSLFGVPATKELARYATSGRGTVRFPIDEPVPVALIRAIAKRQAKGNLERAAKPRRAASSPRKRG